ALTWISIFATGTSLARDADLIIVGDNIVTMDGSEVTGVAVTGDRITATGSRDQILGLGGASTRIIELGDQALLPGFIDAHGHFSAVARYLDLLDLSSPPVGQVTGVDDIVQLLRQRIENQQIPPGQLVYGFGYDDSLLAEQRHPTRVDLDRASTQHPIIIRHVSGHLLVANTQALINAGINAATPDPEGGIIRRRPGTQEPNGVMEETAMGAFPGSGSDQTPERQAQLLREAVDIYAGYGITTIQDSNISASYVDRLKSLGTDDPFAVDIVAYIMANPISDEALDAIEAESDYTGGVRIGGIKFTLDGSPQGRTAWLSEPYDEGPPGQGSDYVAYPSYDPDAYRARIGGVLERGVPVLAHANGDAAIELMIDGIDQALAGKTVPDHRSVIIHAQLIRPDQLDRVKDLGIVPSYYSVHPFFWGDWHRLSFGDARASFISPVRATIERQIPFTIHNDSPIVPPDIMRLVSITVNRETRSGHILGPDQRATVMEALNAVTLGAAYQYFEEDEKGSITPGKRADLVILASNPLTTDPKELADIEIVETIARGQTVHRR
ncbi:MAG: amidohydrolase, partial [Gammaproteobacteria bacterium]|nr:amidohydrolase [Gammaproteobacteria bacterium]